MKLKEKEVKEKVCFIICPLDKEGSEIRKRSNDVRDFIIKPVVEKYGYKLIRPDEIATPGIIQIQIISHLLNSELVIADLSGHNANVFYELAIRHATRKPFIQLIQKGQSIPFDICTNRTIEINLEIGDATRAKEQIEEQIKEIEKNPKKTFENPISISESYDIFSKSQDATQRGFATILAFLNKISSKIDKMATPIFSYNPKAEFLKFENPYPYSVKWVSTSEIPEFFLSEDQKKEEQSGKE